MNVVIAAAGTGGHINPGIAIANKIKEEDKNSKVLFIGTNRGLENDLVPRAGYELKTVNAYGIERKLTVQNFKRLYSTIKSIKEAKKILTEFKADVVIGTGGYICMPVILAANKLKIPTLLHESNAFPGVAVRLLSKKVNTVLVGFEDAKLRLKKAKNVVVTGNPTKIKKQNLTSNQKEEIIRSIGLNTNKPIVLVFGGSQGAKSINKSFINIIKNKKNKEYQIIWAAGPSQYEEIKEKLSDDNININNIENVKIVPYIYNMEEIMNCVDVIVARSGAMTITEISNLGKPSILVPLPNVSHNHQLYNAQVLEKVNAAKIILDNEIKGENLNNTIEQIVLNKKTMDKMGQNALKVSTTNAEDKIYNEIKKIIK